MNLKKKFVSFVLPSIASMLVFNLYTMVDGIFIANYAGETALAAVNLAMPFINFMFAFSLLFAIGASTLISIHRGAGRTEKADQLFSMNTAVLSVLAFLISVLCVLFSRPLALFLGAGPDTLDYVVQYLKIIGGFGFFFIVSYSFEVLIKADGFPKLSTFGVLLGAVTNIVLDALFVFGFHWGLAGAAWATGISQLLTFTVFLCHFLYQKKTHFHFTRFRLDLSQYRRILPIGIADCITELSAGIIVFAFNHQILKYIGTSGVVSYTVITYVYNLVLMAMVGIAQGTQPLVSYSLGQKDIKTIRTIYRYGLTAAALLSVISLAVCYGLSAPIVSVFIRPQETELFQATIQAFRTYSLCFLVMGYNVLTSGFFVALAQPRSALAISVSRGIVVILACLYTLTGLFQAAGIWITPLVSESLCLLLSLCLIIRTFHSQLRTA